MRGKCRMTGDACDKEACPWWMADRGKGCAGCALHCDSPALSGEVDDERQTTIDWDGTEGTSEAGEGATRADEGVAEGVGRVHEGGEGWE